MRKLLFLSVFCGILVNCEKKQRIINYEVDQYISKGGYLVTKAMKYDSNYLGTTTLSSKIDTISLKTNDSIMLIRKKEAEQIIDKYKKIESVNGMDKRR